MRRLILTWLVHCFWARSSTTATIPTNLYWNSTNPLFHQVTILGKPFLKFFLKFFLKLDIAR